MVHLWEESFYADIHSKMKRVGNGFKMGRWEVGFLQVGAWVFIGGCLVVNLVHEELKVATCVVDTDGRQNWRCRGRGTIAYLWVRWRGWWYQSMIITLVLDGNRMKSKANPPARPCSPLSAALGDLCATFLPRSRLSGGLGVIKLFWSLLSKLFSYCPRRHFRHVLRIKACTD